MTTIVAKSPRTEFNADHLASMCALLIVVDRILAPYNKRRRPHAATPVARSGITADRRRSAIKNTMKVEK